MEIRKVAGLSEEAANAIIVAGKEVREVLNALTDGTIDDLDQKSKDLLFALVTVGKGVIDKLTKSE